MTAPTLLDAEVGIFDGLTFAEYLALDGLSHSASRKLLPPHAPAVFRWEQDHPREPSETLEFGSAVHQLVLGDPQDRIVEVPFATWTGKEAKAARVAAREVGLIPLLTKTLAEVREVADAISSNSLASDLFSAGKPEQVIRWIDPDSGVLCKARLDWLPNKRKGRVKVADLKTAQSADPKTWVKSAADYGYDTQQEWYLGGLRTLGLADDNAEFVFVVVQKAAPHLISFPRISDPEDVEIAQHRNRKARQIYAECVRTDTWPGLPQQFSDVQMPGYYRAQNDDAFEMEIAG